MRNMRTVLTCAHLNFKKWVVEPKIYVVFAMAALMMVWMWEGVTRYSLQVGVPVTPWGLAFSYGQTALILMSSSLLLLFYSNAPFADGHTPFVVIRTGRRNWILGQVVYIIESSFVYMVFHVVCMLLILSPSLSFSGDWGSVMETLAQYPSDYTGSLYPYDAVLAQYSGPVYSLIGMVFLWLVPCFMGMLILFFNVISGRNLGVAVGGVFIFLSYFVFFIGSMTFGGRIYWISPLTWICPAFLSGGPRPTEMEGLCVLLIAIVVLAAGSVITVCKKDMTMQKGGL